MCSTLGLQLAALFGKLWNLYKVGHPGQVLKFYISALLSPHALRPECGHNVVSQPSALPPCLPRLPTECAPLEL